MVTEYTNCLLTAPWDFLSILQSSAIAHTFIILKLLMFSYFTRKFRTCKNINTVINYESWCPLSLLSGVPVEIFDPASHVDRLDGRRLGPGAVLLRSIRLGTRQRRPSDRDVRARTDWHALGLLVSKTWSKHCGDGRGCGGCGD